LIAALAEAGIDYVLIGVLAVAAHGYPRATKDIDIVPAPDPANLERLASLPRALGAEHYGLGDSCSRSRPTSTSLEHCFALVNVERCNVVA
jgi:hypothetical protein